MSHELEYRTLGLAPGAGWDEVKSAFRRLARTCHPDVVGPAGTRRFAEITRAYMTLKDTMAREGSSPRGSASAASPPRARSRRAARGRLLAPLRSSLTRAAAAVRALFAQAARERARRRAEERENLLRDREVERILARAEARMADLLARAGESAPDAEAALARLRSRRPEVVLLALERLSTLTGRPEVRGALAERLRREEDPEILRRILSLYPRPDGEIDAALARAAPRLDPSSAEFALRRFRSFPRLDPAYLLPFLEHRSPRVIGEALAIWPPSAAPPDLPLLARLLASEEEVLLIPLLRLLRRGRVPGALLPRLRALAGESPFPAVRVWALAIVRENGVG